jgi:DNA-binding NarL/FixJ family response regulator
MNIVLLDDHTLFLRGLEKIIQEHFPNTQIFPCKSIQEYKSKCKDIEPVDFLVSDIELPNENIFEFFREFKSLKPNVPILVVSMHNKLSVIRKCKYEFQIPGYILKDDKILVPEVMKIILNGEKYYSEETLETLKILEQKEILLTPKEEDIIKFLVDGLSNSDISEKLFISYNTVKTHRKNINRKLGLNTTADLIKYYYNNYIQ